MTAPITRTPAAVDASVDVSQVRSPRTSQRNNQGKRVSFEKRTTTHEVPYLFEPDDVEIFYYTSDEIRCFRLRNKHIVEAMRSQLSLDDLGECTRGLERELPEMKKRTNNRMRDASVAIFFHQHNNADQETIARAYGRAIKSASRDAAIIGRLDAKFVQDTLSSESPTSDLLTSRNQHGSVPKTATIIPPYGTGTKIGLSRTLTVPKTAHRRQPQDPIVVARSA